MLSTANADKVALKNRALALCKEMPDLKTQVEDYQKKLNKVDSSSKKVNAKIVIVFTRGTCCMKSVEVATKNTTREITRI